MKWTRFGRILHIMMPLLLLFPLFTLGAELLRNRARHWEILVPLRAIASGATGPTPPSEDPRDSLAWLDAFQEPTLPTAKMGTRRGRFFACGLEASCVGSYDNRKSPPYPTPVAPINPVFATLLTLAKVWTLACFKLLRLTGSQKSTQTKESNIRKSFSIAVLALGLACPSITFAQSSDDKMGKDKMSSKGMSDKKMSNQEMMDKMKMMSVEDKAAMYDKMAD